MGGNVSTIPENRENLVITPPYQKPTNQLHWSNNYVPQSRAPIAPACAPFPTGNYNPPSANIVAPTFSATRPSIGVGNCGGRGVGGLPLSGGSIGSGVGGLPMSGGSIGSGVGGLPMGGGGVGSDVGGLPLKDPNAKEVIVFHSSTKWREYFEASKQSNKLVVIYFTATWCGPCKYVEPTIKELAAKHTNIDIVKIDVDELFNVSREYRIQTMPTFLFMKNGKQIDKVLGVKKEELYNKVEKHNKA